MKGFTEDLNFEKYLKDKKFKEIVSYYETIKSPQTIKDYGYLVKAYKKLNKVDKSISTLEEVNKKYKDLDVFKRELAKAYEKKYETFYTEKTKDLKKSYYLKALNIHEELRSKRPTKINFYSYINFNMRYKNYDEIEVLLDEYKTKYKSDKFYFSTLCSLKFENKLYQEASEFCVKVKDKDEQSFLYYVKSKEFEKQLKGDSENLIKQSGRFPASSSVNFEIGKRLFLEDKFLDSLTYLGKASKISPSGEIFRLIAESYFELEKYVDSLKNFRKACMVEKKSKSHIFNKIRVFSKKIPKDNPIQEKFMLEVSRCKHSR